MAPQVLFFVIAQFGLYCRSVAKFTSNSMEVEEILPLCQSIRDLGEQPQNRQRIREEISRSSGRDVRSWIDIGTPHNRLYGYFPVLHTCMQVASRMSRRKLSTQTLAYDQTWGPTALKTTMLCEVTHIAVIDISDLDAWGMFLGEKEDPRVITSKDIASYHHTARQWQQITKAKLADWDHSELLCLDLSNVVDVPTVEGPPTHSKSLYAVAAERIWKEDRYSLLHLEPLLCEKWLTHMALERRDIWASTHILVPFLKSLLSGLSSVDLRAMPHLTARVMLDLAQTCGSNWTSLDLSRHKELQSEDIISIIKQLPNLRLLSLSANHSSDFDLPKILEVAGQKCQIEHPALYQRYFQRSDSKALSTKPLIGQIVVAETDNDEITGYKIAGVANEYISVLQCGTVLQRLQRESTDKDKHPASHLDALIMIENSFAVEDNNAVRPMPPLTRKWAKWRYDLDFSPEYDLDCWTLLVQFRKYGAPTFEYTFAKSTKTSKRKRCEIDSGESSIVLGGLDMVAKADGFDTTLSGINLNVPTTWTDGSAQHAFVDMLKQLESDTRVLV